MLRCALFAVAVCAILPNTRAAAPDPSGNWIVSTVSATGESAACVIKVETAGGKSTATVTFKPKGVVEASVSDFVATDKEISFSLKRVQEFNKQNITTDAKFVGVVAKDGKVVLGSLGTDARPLRAKLVRTDKTELTPVEAVVRGPATAEYGKAIQAANRPLVVQGQMQREKDAEKKTELRKELAAAREEATKVPNMYRDIVAKNPDAVIAAEAAMSLFRSTDAKLTPDEAAKLAEVVRKHSDPYGPRYAKPAMTALAEAVAVRKDVGTLAVSLLEPVAKGLTDATPPADQVRVLELYTAALAGAGKAADAKPFEAKLEKLNAKLDTEYLATVPPFKPTPFAGRKTEGANRVAVFELFTGAQCPPCVAADVAFDALLKAYKPTDVVCIQYHVHIPGPDPLTNADTQARAQYYAVNSAPTSLFNGERGGGTGGGMAASESKFKQYVGVIDPLLEQKTAAKVSGSAVRVGDKINIGVTVDGAEGDDLRLRLLVVEDTVRYVGGNRIRFHHNVVRAMPGGAEGFAIKKESVKHVATADVAAIKSSLTKYLNDYAANRPFPNANRPMDMKNLKVIALLQNDKTKEIVQAAQFDIGDKPAGGAGE
jgi:hypothetical protein